LDKPWQDILDSRQKEVCCVVCGYNNLDAIERHHIQREPALIIDLCRNCHRIVTKYEMGWFIQEESAEVIRRYLACKKLIAINLGR